MARKKKFGDRKDGRYLRKLDAYNKFAAYIMYKRNDATNFFEDSIEVTEIDRYLRAKRAEGYKGMGMLHLMIAAYIRVVSQRPAMNRFVSGSRIYARNNIEVVMTVKKEMKSEAAETSIKVYFEPTDTIYDVYHKMNAEIEKVRGDGESNDTDDIAETLMKFPRLFLKFAVFVLNIIDYFGGLPKSLLHASPFHGSLIVTDLGSLGIPPVFHHLYNFGNLPIFIAFGAKRRCYEVEKDGSVVERKYIDYRVSADERICDGFYFGQAFKYLKSYMRHPEVLDQPPAEVFEDE